MTKVLEIKVVLVSECMLLPHVLSHHLVPTRPLLRSKGGVLYIKKMVLQRLRPSEEELRRALCHGEPRFAAKELSNMLTAMIKVWLKENEYLRSVVQMVRERAGDGGTNLMDDLRARSYERLHEKLCSEEGGDLGPVRLFAYMNARYTILDFGREYRKKPKEVASMSKIGKALDPAAGADERMHSTMKSAMLRRAFEILAQSNGRMAAFAKAYLAVLEAGVNIPGSSEKKKRRELLEQFSEELREMSPGAFNSAHARFRQLLAETLKKLEAEPKRQEG